VRRLNATAYGRWQVLAPRVTVADNKALVTLTLDLSGTPFVGTGEAFFSKTVKGEDVVNDHAVEDAWAEAMKGACNTADLGLYLRFLPQLQFPYRTKWRSFDDEPGIATTLYQLAGLPVPEGAGGVMPVTPVGEEVFANRAGVGSADNPDGKAAGTQLTSLRNLYRNLQLDEPGDLDTLTWAQAKGRIAELTAQLSQRRKSAAA
jgi:hypothetical protein